MVDNEAAVFGAKGCVLVVDDSPAIRLSLLKILQKEGLRALEADSGPSALAVLGREEVDLLLTDLKMPGMDGLAFMRRLRERPLAPRAIAVTAYSDDAHRAQALAAGFARVEFKPIVPAQFLDVVIAEIGAAGR